MKTVSRRGLLAGGVAAGSGILLRTRPGRAAEFNYRLGFDTPATDPIVIRLNEASDAIKQRTGGRVDIRVIPNGQLGTGPEMLNQVRSGAIQFFPSSSAVLSALLPIVGLPNIAFALSDYAKVWQAVDGELGRFVRAQILAQGTVVPMDRMWDVGFRQISTSSRQVRSPSDMAGLKLRVPPSPLYSSMFAALGAAPAALPFGELYTALQTHLVDGQDNPLQQVWSSKFYEVQKYETLSNHIWDGLWILANRRAWERLPDDAKQVVAEELNAKALLQRADSAAQSGTLQTTLAEKGMTFLTPEPGVFRDALRKTTFYADWRKNYGEAGWTALESGAGPLN